MYQQRCTRTSPRPNCTTTFANKPEQITEESSATIRLISITLFYINCSEPSWSSSQSPVTFHPFTAQSGPTTSLSPSLQAIFKIFFTSSLITTIIEQTNLFAKECINQQAFEKFTRYKKGNMCVAGILHFDGCETSAKASLATGGLMRYMLTRCHIFHQHTAKMTHRSPGHLRAISYVHCTCCQDVTFSNKPRKLSFILLLFTCTVVLKISEKNGSEFLCRDGTKTRWWFQ